MDCRPTVLAVTLVAVGLDLFDRSVRVTGTRHPFTSSIVLGGAGAAPDGPARGSGEPAAQNQEPVARHRRPVRGHPCTGGTSCRRGQALHDVSMTIVTRLSGAAHLHADAAHEHAGSDRRQQVLRFLEVAATHSRGDVPRDARHRDDGHAARPQERGRRGPGTTQAAVPLLKRLNRDQRSAVASDEVAPGES